MPTGYTAEIAKGISFEQYALNCARAFGALIMMRDEPMDASIPNEFEPSDYHVKRLAEAKERLEFLDKLTAKELEHEAKRDYQQQLERYHKIIADCNGLRDKYDAMLEKAKAYVPPTDDHVEYAKFLVSQIEESIRFDCSLDYLEAPKRQTGPQWLGEQVRKAQHDIEYHTAENEKEIERTESRNKWIKALRESLNTPTTMTLTPEQTFSGKQSDHSCNCGHPGSVFTQPAF